MSDGCDRPPQGAGRAKPNPSGLGEIDLGKTIETSRPCLLVFLKSVLGGLPQGRVLRPAADPGYGQRWAGPKPSIRSARSDAPSMRGSAASSSSEPSTP